MPSLLPSGIMSISATDGIPRNLVASYDIIGLNAYRHSTYNGAFHLLAMKAAERLAYQMGELPYYINLRSQQSNQEVLDIPNSACM